VRQTALATAHSYRSLFRGLKQISKVEHSGSLMLAFVDLQIDFLRLKSPSSMFGSGHKFLFLRIYIQI